jgi:shikimate dehydrogenase
VILLAVFGHPVTRSRSPAIHRLFGAQFGLEVDYRAIDARPGTFLEQVRELARAGGRGCNVTVPLKRAAWQAAPRCSAVAARAEAANTLVFDTVTDWFADNTDGRGLVRDLQRLLPGGPRGRRILIAGAGGAAAGILGDLLLAGAAAIHVANRTPARAAALASRHRDLGPVTAGGFNELGSQDRFDLVIDATSAGHGGDRIALPPTVFGPGALCYDLNYGAAARALGAWCAERGIACQDGLGMLVEQAGLSFELWTGKAPDCAAVLERMRAEPAGA